jgi:teichuronic acid biosynthesis glycosyltransferase TuaG
MSQELVSIITPSYNSGEFISETIKSIQNQTYRNWELLITDDFSSDNTVKIIKSFIKDDNRIQLFQLDKNSGAAMARNNSIKRALGRFIAFLDSDDTWLPNKLITQLKFMTYNKAPISFTSYFLMNDKGVSLNKTIKSIEKVNYHQYLKNTIIGMSTSMIDTSKVSHIVFKNIRTRQDTYLWISLLKQGHTAYGIGEPLGIYRVRSNSISANKIKSALQVWKLYFNFEKLGFIKSLYYLIFYLFNAIKKRILS